MYIEAAGDTSFIDAGVNDIAESMGFGADDTADDPEIPVGEEPGTDEEGTEDETTTAVVLPTLDKDGKPVGEVTAPVGRALPKSWSKDKAEAWAKMPADAQEYWEKREKDFLDGLEPYKKDQQFARSINDLIAPHRQQFASVGMSDTQAVQELLSWNQRLTNGSLEDRRAAYEQMGRELGFAPAAAATLPDGQPDPLANHPIVQKLQKELQTVQSSLTAKQQQDFRAHQQTLKDAEADAARKVEAFSSDPKNLHFEAVASDMVPLINAGLTIEDAYEKAVWGNPVTRALEQAKAQTAQEEAWKKKALAEGTAARKATAANVRGADTTRTTPTEPKGKLLDEKSMLADLASIRSRQT